MKRQRLTRDESRALTRERLLEGAKEVFSRNGFGGATVEEIAESAGYTKGAFYSNFESKETVLLTLLEEHTDRELAALTGLLAAGLPLDELPLRIAAYYATTVSELDCGLLSAEFQLEAARNAVFSKQFQTYFNEHRRALIRLLKLFFKQSSVPPPASMSEFASILMALSVGVALQERALDVKQKGLFGEALMLLLRPASTVILSPSRGGKRKR